MFGGQGTGGGGFNFGTPAASTTGNTAGAGFSFGAPTTAGPSATPNTGFSFGAAPPAYAASMPTAPSGGGGGGGFSFGAPPASTGTGGGFTGFGGLGSSSSSAAATTTATGAGLSGLNFGAAAPKPAATTTAAAPAAGFGVGVGASTTTASAPAAAGGFSFGGGAGTGMPGFTDLGGNVSSNAKTGTVTTSATATGGGIGFGGTAAKTTSAGSSLLSGLLGASSTQAPSSVPAATSGTTAASTGFSLAGSTGVPASSGFSFGSSATPATTSTTSLGAGLGLAGFSTAPTSGAVTSTATAISSLPGGQKQMTFRQLEDTINKWTTELEDQEKCFLDQATQVNAWDRIVMENGDKIIQLNKDLERVKLDQQKLDHELDFVHSQQRELEELISPLETALDQLPPISHTQHAQLEREHTYTLAESLDSQLKRMSQDMKEIVERLNSSNVKPDDNDPLQQITKILNAHVVSLMWVDRNSANLQRRAEEIAKMMDLEKKEQERNFRMAYS